MSIGVWEPKRPASVELEKLQTLLGRYRQADPANLRAGFIEDEIRADAHLMKLDESAWEAAEQLGNSDIMDLIRFFTLAEMQLPNWEGGSTSPVIYLVKILRTRDAFPSDLRKWIKRNTDNRFLPYGPAL